MEWETVGVIAEILAAIAVVVSLWYLAIQLGQNTELARANLEVQLGITWAEMHDNMIQNPQLAKAYDLADVEWEKLSQEEIRSYLWFVAKSFHILQGMFRQKQRGLLADEVWRPYEKYISGILQIEAVMRWWSSEGSLISNEFRGYVDTLLHMEDESHWRQISTAEMARAKKQEVAEPNKSFNTDADDADAG
jgi:hypothetical protein